MGSVGSFHSLNVNTSVKLIILNSCGDDLIKAYLKLTLGLNAISFKTISTVNTPVKTIFIMSIASLNSLDCP